MLDGTRPESDLADGCAGTVPAQVTWCICTDMNRWRRWRSRRPVGRASPRHLAVTALAVLLATAGSAVLVSVLTDQAWPPAVIAIIGTVPALYLAFLAVPGVVSPSELATPAKPVFGRPVGWWDPVDLGVHKVIGGGPVPPYVLRPHDELLAAATGSGRVRESAGGGSRWIFDREDPGCVGGAGQGAIRGLAAGLSARPCRPEGAAGRRRPAADGALAGRTAPVRRRRRRRAGTGPPG